MRLVLRALSGAYDYFVLYAGLACLGLLCLIWTPIALIVHPILSERRGRSLGRYVIMAGFRFYLAALGFSRRCKFDVRALDALRAEESLIIAPNHPCLLDAVMVISRLPDVACVLKSRLMNNLFLGAGARLARYIDNKPTRRMVDLAIADLLRGSHLLLFPEGTRTISCPVNPLKASIGLIAHHANARVQTVLIETDSRYLSKGWSLFRKPSMPIHYRVRLGRRFDPPRDVDRFMSELQDYFAYEMAHGSPFRLSNSSPEGSRDAPGISSRNSP